MAVVPSIWFEGTAEEAMNFYAETFPNSSVGSIERYAGDQGVPGEKELKGKVLTGFFNVNGTEFLCLDGPAGVFPANGGNTSFTVEFESQDELDKVWEKLLDGGKPLQCGWITDKFSLTWQIVPKIMGQLMSDPSTTPAQKKALLQAMMPMIKLDGPKLQEAYNNVK